MKLIRNWMAEGDRLRKEQHAFLQLDYRSDGFGAKLATLRMEIHLHLDTTKTVWDELVWYSGRWTGPSLTLRENFRKMRDSLAEELNLLDKMYRAVKAEQCPA